MMTSKDEQLTYEELTALCRKQEPYNIKELEEKLKTPSDTEKSCIPEKETYEELERDRDKLREQLRNKDKLIFALEQSLIKINDELISYKGESERYQEQNYKLRKQLRDNERSG